ncbi:hypothetical protein Tco_0593527 [Tanacetum coccineum]
MMVDDCTEVNTTTDEKVTLGSLIVARGKGSKLYIHIRRSPRAFQSIDNDEKTELWHKRLVTELKKESILSKKYFYPENDDEHGADDGLMLKVNQTVMKDFILILPLPMPPICYPLSGKESFEKQMVYKLKNLNSILLDRGTRPIVVKGFSQKKDDDMLECWQETLEELPQLKQEFEQIFAMKDLGPEQIHPEAIYFPHKRATKGLISWAIKIAAQKCWLVYNKLSSAAQNEACKELLWVEKFFWQENLFQHATYRDATLKDGMVELNKVQTDDNASDMMTKAVTEKSEDLLLSLSRMRTSPRLQKMKNLF